MRILETETAEDEIPAVPHLERISFDEARRRVSEAQTSLDVVVPDRMVSELLQSAAQACNDAIARMDYLEQH